MATASAAPQDRPMVLVYIGDDDPSRGDAHGSAGVGRKIAQKIGGTFHFIGDKDLAALYPEEKTKADALAHYFRDHGKPDVLLSKFWRIHDKALGKDKPLSLFEDNNEYLSHKYLGEHSLVNHHVTPEMLAAEGQKFRDAYPGLPSPLVAVLMAKVDDVEAFAEKLISKAAAHPEAAIFVTSIWRTPPENYEHLMEALTRHAKAQGAEDRLKIIGYPFRKGEDAKARYNPYLGLLDAADHLIVTGHSLSMMTEPMAAGKSPLLFEPGQDHSSLEQKGLVRDFNKAAARAPFDSSKIGPFNPTDAIAEKMAKEFRQKSFHRKLSPAIWMKKIGTALRRAL